MNNKVVNYIKEHKREVSIFTVFSLFLFTMLFNLTHSNLGGDEWVEYYYSQAAIRTGELYQKIISTFQPPLYNFVMHFWLKLGSSIFWFRLFNVFVGLVSGIYLFLTVKQLYSEKTAGICVFSLAVCYRWVYCIQECAEYAIMLLFIFASIYYFIELEHQFSYIKLLFFILACVGAIFSQYGSVFVIAPLLMFYYFNNILDKDLKKKYKISITISYMFSLLVFALPLYIFFLSKQMGNNEISGHTIDVSIGMIKGVPFVLGRIIGYFYGLNMESWRIVWYILSVTIIVLGYIVLKNKKLSREKKSIIFCLFIAYILHYVLVRLHIYAMVHPGQSSGFYCRYSYFYIPLLMVAIPILITEFNVIKPELYKKFMPYVGGASLLCMLVSFGSVLDNWQKNIEDEIAQVWIEQEGWNDTTYLLGASVYAFPYYTKNLQHDVEKITTKVDVEYLPAKFWVWRTHWGEENYNKIMEKAEALDYDINVIFDDGPKGALVCCSYNDDYVDLSLDQNELKIIHSDINDTGQLELKLEFNSQTELPLYNAKGYKITYHIVDLEYNKIKFYNKKYKIGSWISDEGYDIVITPEVLEDDKDYIIQIDILREDGVYMSKKGFKMPEIKILNDKIAE